MCGIAGGAWTKDGEPIDEVVLRRMTDVLRHRGPDDDGHFFSEQKTVFKSTGDRSPGAVLGHRRLSIIDLSGGHQPLSNEDGSIWVAFNGEIYNYRELHPQLESLGHQFRSASDTECIVHAYEEWGIDCVHHFRGMFAFAIWDGRKQQLVLARDRMGQKPLVYRYASGRLTFASELKALLEIPGAPRELDPTALADYVTLQYVPHPKTMLRGYFKLPPAHLAQFNARTGDLAVRRYWEAPYVRTRPLGTAPDRRLMNSSSGSRDSAIEDESTHKRSNADSDDRIERSLDEWKTMLRDRLTEAVRLRMRSDVPFGAFLSGGVDSTIIAGLMQEQVAHKVQTFSIGFSVKQFDERTYAREAASRLNTEHHEFVVDPSAVEMLPQLIHHYDEPFADSSAIPTMYLSQLARRHVTVALTGDGGDELFAGYDRYLAVDLATKIDRLPQFIRSCLASPLWQWFPTPVGQKSKLRRIKRFLAALGQSPERRYSNWVSIFDDVRRPSLLSPDLSRDLDGYDGSSFLLEAYSRCAEANFVHRTTCVDVETYLPCDILTKVDIASMTYGLEARSPFMDHPVVELAAQMPIALKLRHGRGKCILVDTFSDLLPESIQTRPKMGFGVPLDHWFRGELRPMLMDTLLDSKTQQRGYFDSRYVKQLVDEHTSSQWDHSARLWLLLVFELWHRAYVDQSAAG